jgi:hypothetical protein
MSIIPLLLCAVLLLGLDGGAARAEGLLEIEAKIPLGKVSGRIDHLAIDLDHHRLFVAELGNDSVGMVDLDQRKLAQRIGNLSEPQGVAYLPKLATLVVSNAHDGSVRFFSGSPLSLVGQLELKDDADNIRVLPDGQTIVIGYGNGALAVIDAVERRKRADIRLKGHPEAFQFDPKSSKIFVNIPDAGEIAVVDRELGRQVGQWRSKEARANFPMAVLGERGEVASIFRKPATIVSFRTSDGAITAGGETCGDGDDVFYDARRGRLYITCGEGLVEVLVPDASGFRRLGRVPTVVGARTGLFVPELDRLFVAVRARGAEPAAIWVFKPV